MNNEQWIQKELTRLRKQDLNRDLVTYTQTGGIVRIGSRSFINFSSNDYLNLANDSGIINSSDQMLHQAGTGATASRLLTGTLTCHTELEKRLASFKGYPSALVFGSGYLTNLGTISSLVGKNDHVFTDYLVHASIIDAVILSRAKVHRFNHNDPDHLKILLKKCPAKGNRLVVTESVFSMDGDLAPLQEIADIANSYGAMLMVDEAHSTGVFGPHGRGLISEFNLESMVNVSMATLSKALGGYGGFVTCSRPMHDLLINKARSFIYTTALPPAAIGSALGALDKLNTNPDMGSILLNNASFFRTKLQEAGLDTACSNSQIIPIIVGDTAKTLALSRRLKEKGILAIAIRPPTVPRGTSRLRLSITLGHSREVLEKAAEIIKECALQEGVV